MLLNSFRVKAMTAMTTAFSSITVEPLMLLDGLAFSNMHVYIENLQMDRVCRVNAGYSEVVCHELKQHAEASVDVQQRYSVFALYNGIIAAALPLFFILFMGAWSDKYGRKVPLLTVQIGHLLHAGGYLLASLELSWPVEFFLLATLLDTLGGGAVSFLTAANSYISDVSSKETRTSRVGLVNGIWFLGGPAGTLLGNYIYKNGGYLPLFATSLLFSLMAIVYIVIFLPESHGPFARKDRDEIRPSHQKTVLSVKGNLTAVYDFEVKEAEDSKLSLRVMIKDFFNPKCIIDSFKSTLRKREGNTRLLLLLLIFTSLLKKLTRSPYVFAFTRHELGWKASDYSLWVTYKNLVATIGSLVAVPLLSGRLKVSDNFLATLGAMSGVVEYVVYGYVTEHQQNLIWIAPIAALFLNSCSIAQKSMMTKIINKDEIGKVSAVFGALEGIMPMVSSAFYTAVYHSTVSSFPAAHFFVGAAISTLMMALFAIIAIDSWRRHHPEKEETLEIKSPFLEKKNTLSSSKISRENGMTDGSIQVVKQMMNPCDGKVDYSDLGKERYSDLTSWPKRFFQGVKIFLGMFQKKDSLDVSWV